MIGASCQAGKGSPSSSLQMPAGNPLFSCRATLATYRPYQCAVPPLYHSALGAFHGDRYRGLADGRSSTERRKARQNLEAVKFNRARFAAACRNSDQKQPK